MSLMKVMLHAQNQRLQNFDLDKRNSNIKVVSDMGEPFLLFEVKDISLNYRSPDREDLQVVIPVIRGERLEHGNGELELKLAYREQLFTLSGNIDLFDPEQNILDYHLALAHGDLDFSSKGRLILSPNLEGSDLSAELELRRVDRLAAIADAELPASVLARGGGPGASASSCDG